MPVVTADSTYQLLQPGTDTQFLVVNTDTANLVYLSQQKPVSSADTPLPPGGSASLTGWWYASTLDSSITVQCNVLPGGQAWSASPSQIVNPTQQYAVTNKAIASGASVSLTAVDGTQLIGVSGSSCYDLVLNVQAGNGSTFPFAKVSVFWFDPAGTHAVGQEIWRVPMAPHGGTLLVRGSGEARGSLMQIVVANLDSVDCLVQEATVFTSARQQVGSDWRTNPQQAASPGFTMPTTGEGFDNVPGILNNVTLAGNGTATYQLGLFAGAVYLRATALHSSTGGTEFAVRTANDASGYDTIWDPLSTSGSEPLATVVFPRAACHLDVTNNDGVQVNLFFVAMAQPIS